MLHAGIEPAASAYLKDIHPSKAHPAQQRAVYKHGALTN